MPRITKAMKQRCIDAVNATAEHLLSLGAIERDCDTLRGIALAAREFTIDTKAGSLWLQPHAWDGNDFSVFGRFSNVQQARALFGNTPSRLNVFSGKWNFHFFADNAESGLEQFKRELEAVL